MTSRDSLGRRSRDRPISTGKRIRLTDRDQLWLEALARHGPLSSSFLLGFAAGLGVSKKRAQERLTDLFNENNTQHGGPYLIRPPQQFHTLDSRYNQLVYELSDAGWRALGAGRANRLSGGGPWLHRFMVSSITASIELAIAQRPDLTFIPQLDILNRANATLDTKINLPGYQRPIKLIPDALFGIEYQSNGGARYRFYVVEADRATEPLTSQNFNRKSAKRSFHSYEAYVGKGLYRKHLNLTAPILVLNVFSEAARAEKVRELYGRLSGGGVSYQLFQSWGAFAPPFRPPNPNSNLLLLSWNRPGYLPLNIDG